MTTLHTANAPAKLNLGLTVLGRREDGYHDIFTTFVAIDLVDRLRFVRRIGGGVRLIVRAIAPEDRALFPTDERNLMVRAIRLYEKQFGFDAELTIEIDKRIPIGGGLGGGSSDAAATIRAMERLYGFGSTAGQRHEWARSLGADVPFFLHGGCAEAAGIGDELMPVTFHRDWWAVVLTPPYPIATKEVYARYRLTGFRDPVRFGGCRSAQAFYARLARVHNDLGEIAESFGPTLRTARRWLADHGARAALVSGSGSSVFGVFDAPPDDIADEFGRCFPGRVAVCRPTE